MSESKAVTFKQEEDDKPVKSHTTETDTDSNMDMNEEGKGEKYKAKKHLTTNATMQGYDYRGKHNDIGVILALRSERFNNRVVFLTFVDKMKV